MIEWISNARAKSEEYQRDCDNVKNLATTRERELSAFRHENKLLTTATEFRSFGETITKPGNKYCIDNVLTPGGLLPTIRKRLLGSENL